MNFTPTFKNRLISLARCICIWGYLSSVFLLEASYLKEYRSQEELSTHMAHSMMLSRVNPASAIHPLLERFVKTIKVWEKNNGKPFTMKDLIAPYLNESGEIHASSIAKGLYIAKDERFQHVLASSGSWLEVGIFFTGFPAYDASRVLPYEWLFGLQIIIESFLIGVDSDADGTSFLSGSYSRDSHESLAMDHSKFKSFMDVPSLEYARKYRKLFTDVEHRRYVPPTCFVDCLTGLVLDPPRESILSRVSRFIRRVPPPERMVSELPRTSEEAPWRYLHEVRGDYGLHVFMHMFPQLRGECKKLADYGMERDVIGDELYNELTRPFVQPPYELPASVFADEAAMMADTEGGGAAAAAASSSGTDTHESRALSSSSRPAAAAAASCADLPDESDDSRETDRLLGGTGPYVRHRAVAMAAAAAVEEELRTSSS